MAEFNPDDSEENSFLKSKIVGLNIEHDFITLQQLNRPPTVSRETHRSKPIITQLERSNYVLFLALGYTFFALFSWIVTCILTYQPIGSRAYGFQGGTFVADQYTLAEQTTSWYRAARVMQSVVSILTVPLASAVCAKAVVSFTQNSGRRHNATMRQTMLLADKGWIDPLIWMKLLRHPSQYKRYGSLFLIWAIIVVLLGAVSAPLQELFLSQSSRKVPYEMQVVQDLTDISGLFDSGSYVWGDDNFLTVLTRSAMTSTALSSIQPRLWQRSSSLCGNTTLSPAGDFADQWCTVGGSSLLEMTMLQEPFFAPLPSNFSTGLVRQFSPRINSSSHLSNISSSDWPTNCDTRQNSFFARYGNLSDTWSWNITLCMPANYSNPFVHSTRLRQDFSELLYVNISVTGFEGLIGNETISALYKVDLATTVGYFELPNYMNGQTAGPLLTVDPQSLCGRDCAPQGYQNTSISPTNQRRTSDGSTSQDTALQLEGLINKPPLLSIVMALFGQGSYLAERMAHPDDFLYTWNHESSTQEEDHYYGRCVDAFPWIPLTYNVDGQSLLGESAECIKNSVEYSSDLTVEMVTFIFSFVPVNWTASIPVGIPTDRLENAFNAAAFLANEVLLTRNPNSHHYFLVWFDEGQDVQAPSISLPGIVVVSIVLSLFLSNLLAVAVYSCRYPRWTNSLDSFAMMRFGAAYHEHLPSNYVGHMDGVKILDQLPGYIGDIAAEGAEFGQLGIGVDGPLRRKRKYLSNVREADSLLANT